MVRPVDDVRRYLPGWLLFLRVQRIDDLVADAAELGSKLAYDTASPTSYTTSLKNMVVYGDEIAGTKALVPNLTTGNVNVNVSLDTAGMPRDVTITVTGYTIDALFKSYALNNKPRATTMYYGQISCSTC